MTTFLAFYRPGPNWRQAGLREVAAEGQREYLKHAVERGLVVRAGALDDGGEFLIMLAVPSRTIAERFVARDPSVKVGVQTATVHRFDGDHDLVASKV